MSKQTRTEERRRWLPVMIACFLLIGAAAWASTLLPQPTGNKPREVQGEKTTQPYLGTWKGKLARFDGVHTEPVEVYDVDISTLPEEEQRRLAAGITWENEEALGALLDSYTS